MPPTPDFTLKKGSWFGIVAKCWPNTHKTLGSIPSTTRGGGTKSYSTLDATNHSLCPTKGKGQHTTIQIVFHYRHNTFLFLEHTSKSQSKSIDLICGSRSEWRTWKCLPCTYLLSFCSMLCQTSCEHPQLQEGREGAHNLYSVIDISSVCTSITPRFKHPTPTYKLEKVALGVNSKISTYW